MIRISSLLLFLLVVLFSGPSLIHEPPENDNLQSSFIFILAISSLIHIVTSASPLNSASCGRNDKNNHIISTKRNWGHVTMLDLHIQILTCRNSRSLDIFHYVYKVICYWSYGTVLTLFTTLYGINESCGKRSKTQVIGIFKSSSADITKL